MSRLVAAPLVVLALPVLVAAAACSSPTLVARASTAGAPTAVLFSRVNVFDGEAALGERDVLVKDGVIAAVADAGALASDPSAAGAVVIDGAGKTLLPGFVDAHAHFESHGEALWDVGLPRMDDIANAYVYAGVTTTIVMQAREEQFEIAARAKQGELVAPRMFLAGPRVTAPDGFPINLYRALLPWPFDAMMTASMLTAATPDEARAHVDAVATRFAPHGDAPGVTFMKLTSDAFPPGAPKLSPETLSASIARAKERGLAPTAHLGAPEDFVVAADAGLALFAHPPSGARFTEAQLARLAEKKVPIVSTQRFLTASNDLAKDGGTRLDREMMRGETLATFARRPADFEYPGVPPGLDAEKLLADYEANLRENVVAARAAGVPVFVGTDAGSPGVIPGSSLHRELRALVAAGMTPVDALRAATSAPADFLATLLRLPDAARFGRVAVGRRADLVLVAGDPTTDIAATEAVVEVLLDGKRVTRTRLP